VLHFPNRRKFEIGCRSFFKYSGVSLSEFCGTGYADDWEPKLEVSVLSIPTNGMIRSSILAAFSLLFLFRLQRFLMHISRGFLGSPEFGLLEVLYRLDEPPFRP
jgi:hypothetical protein